MKLFWLILLVLLIRLPFLNQAVTGDDNYYLASAEHAQIDPLHPNHTTYVFQGKDVDFRGYPHPPLNAWYLALWLAIFRDFNEVPYHAAYLIFSLICAAGIWSLAQRFSPHPFWAALAFMAVPAFVINGNSFESDVPLLAFWTAGIALFINGVDTRRTFHLLASAVCLGLASLTAVQAVFAIPILAFYLYPARWKAAWLTVLSPAIALTAWQIFEYCSIGRFPILITTGYVQSYKLDTFQLKVTHAGGLIVHACFMMFPLLLPFALLQLFKRRDRDTNFLLAWIGIFFAAALVLFYSGSARYLLPIAAPMALLVSRLPVKYLRVAIPIQLVLSMLLACANYQHWSGYRDFARSLSQQTRTHRTWVNAEWGLRWYLEADGALPLHQDQHLNPGGMLVASELAYPVTYNRGGSVLVTVAQRDITSRIPLRLIGLNSHSGYSTSQKGFLPFGISTDPIDHVSASILVARQATMPYLSMGLPKADDQIISGIYGREGSNPWRWTSQIAIVALRNPAQPQPIHVELTIPDASPVRAVKVLGNDAEIYSRQFDQPGTYSFDTPPTRAGTVTLQFDKAFFALGDGRELGVILSRVGYQK